MTENIKVISSDIDGADLRRQMVRNRYYARCDGRQDNEQIQDALGRAVRGGLYGIPPEDYERIFGGKDGRR